ncbi:MAG TPA: hypothetical protein VGZ52_10460 [Acidimicrobiales bacterium]|nr:hypothetical protein [Acidimicrobiales bacterium]
MNVTRDALHRVATHVLARARFAATGKFGLRATPGGIGTPAFGAAIEVLRIDGDVLIRERDGKAAGIGLVGSSLADLARFADVDLSAPFAAGDDTPALGPVDQPLPIDAADLRVISDWFDLGWRVLDAAAAGARDAMAVQLWPEHFDAGTSVRVGPGDEERCNLGASPGDAYSDEPYLYLGPWSPDRPDDSAYWNAPFGAVLRRGDLTTPDPYAAGLEFFRHGLELLR